MTIAPVERVRQAICDQLSRLCADTVTSLHETILIRNGLYCGRKFQFAGYEVVWFVEEDQIKFFSPCGDLLSVESAMRLTESSAGTILRVDPAAQVERRAA